LTKKMKIMSAPIQIDIHTLQQLLQSENPDSAEINKYFELDTSSAFGPGLKLREGIEIIEDQKVVAQGAILHQKVLNLLNWNSRKGRDKKYVDFINLRPDFPRIVSEGDSWFQHPLVPDIIDYLLTWFPVYSCGAAGDTLRNMHAKPEHLLEAIDREKPRIVLLSAGGNDVLGDPQFAGFLNDYTPGIPGENIERFLNQTFFDEIKNLTAIYVDFCKTLTLRYPDIDMCLHGYDYIIPNNPNVPWKIYMSKDKSWLGKPMIDRGITEEKDKKGIIQYIINVFNEIIQNIEKDIDRVHYINLRDTVTPDKWNDEIHPSAEGYQDLAIKFKKKINDILYA